MIVVITAEAESDLEQIATYIAGQSVEIALFSLASSELLNLP